MSVRSHSLLLALAAGLVLGAGGRGDEKKPAYTGVCAAPVDDFFKDEVWAKVAVHTCLTCHKVGGDAEDSKFILEDPRRAQGAAQQDEAMRQNRDAFARMA